MSRRRPLAVLVAAVLVLGASLATTGTAAAASARADAPVAAPRLDQVDRAWLVTAAGIVQAIQDEAQRLAPTGGSLTGARLLLQAGQSLFETAVAYGVMSTCTTRLHDAGSPSKALRAVETDLKGACATLGKASALFEAAARDQKPALLLQAEKQASTGLARLQRVASRLSALRKA